DIEVANSRKRQIMYRVQATNIMIARQQLKLSTDATTLKDALVGAVYDNKNTDTTEDKRLDDGTSDIDTLDAFEYTFENDIEKIIDAFDSDDTIEDDYQSFYEIFIYRGNKMELDTVQNVDRYKVQDDVNYWYNYDDVDSLLNNTKDLKNIIINFYNSQIPRLKMLEFYSLGKNTGILYKDRAEKDK